MEKNQAWDPKSWFWTVLPFQSLAQLGKCSWSLFPAPQHPLPMMAFQCRGQEAGLAQQPAAVDKSETPSWVSVCLSATWGDSPASVGFGTQKQDGR